MTAGQPNGVDLSGYLFINGPVLKAIKRASPNSDAAPVMLTLEECKASKRDIGSIENALKYRKQTEEGCPAECFPFVR